MKTISKSLANEPGPQDAGASGDQAEPEYTFEGYTIEFSLKIALTPPAKGAQEKIPVVH